MASSWKILLSLFFVFFVSFVVFPGALLDFKLDFMKGLGNRERSWFSISVITAFNVMNTLGTFAAGRVMLKPWTIYLGSWLRSLLVVSTFLIVIYDHKGRKDLLNSPVVKITNLLVVGFTNGFISTQCAIQAPQFVVQEQREQIGMFVGLAIVSGVFLGSMVAIPVGEILPANWSV